MVEIVPDSDGAVPDGGAICPKCGPVPSERVLRVPEGRI
jgi:hypothetical protein